MKLTQAKDFYFSLIIGESDLRSVINFLKSRYAIIDLSVDCNDGTTIETKEINDIISFENVNYRKIESIRIRALNDAEDLITIEFSSKGPETCELYMITNSDEKGRYVYHEILHKINNMRQWYDWIARVPFFFWILIPWSFFSFLVSLGNSLGYIDVRTYPAPTLYSYVNQLLLFVILLFAISYPLERSKMYLFPKAFFLIGKQISVMINIKKARSLIFGTIILGVLLGIIVNLITNYFFI